MTIPNSPTINIRRLKVELHSIYTRISIISAEHNYVTFASHLFSTSSVDPTYLMSYVYLLVLDKLLENLILQINSKKKCVLRDLFL